MSSRVPTPTPPSTVHGGSAQLTPAARRMVLYAVLTAVFLGTLDGTVVVTALPRIVGRLHGDESVYAWTVTGYLLTSTVSVPLYGRYSDLYGRKYPLLAGIGVFLTGSVLCATAGTFTELLGYRALQGAGAGALMPLGMVLLRDTVDARLMPRLQSLLGAMLAVTLVGGPYLGGVLTDLAGWRSLFWFNLLPGVPVLVVVATLLPGGRGSGGGRPDVWGALLLALGLSSVLVGLTGIGRGGSSGRWGEVSVTGCLAVGAVALVLFVLVERRAAVPVLPLRLFRGRAFTSLITAGFFFSAASLPCTVFLPLYFHQVRGLAATGSGLMLTPLLLAMVAGNRVAARLVFVERLRRPILPAGAVLLLIGCGAFALLGRDTPLWLIVAAMAVVGVSMGPAMAPVGLMAQSVVPPRDAGTATAGVVLLKQLGQSVGLAVGQTLLARDPAPGPGGHAVSASMGSLASGVGQTIALVGVVCGAGALVASVLAGDVEIRLPGDAPARRDGEGEPARRS